MFELSDSDSEDEARRRKQQRRAVAARTARSAAAADSAATDVDRAATVDVNILDKGETQVKSDEMDYCVEGLSKGPASRRASVLRLLETCSSPHSRFILRLGGSLPRLLSALSIAAEVAPGDEAARLGLAAIAVTLLKDRANMEHATASAVAGLVALVAPLAGERYGRPSDAVTGDGGALSSQECSQGSAGGSGGGGGGGGGSADGGGGGGAKRRHALGGKRKRPIASSSSDSSSSLPSSSRPVMLGASAPQLSASETIRRRLELNGAQHLLPYTTDSVTAPELALKALQHMAATESAAVGAATANDRGAAGGFAHAPHRTYGSKSNQDDAGPSRRGSLEASPSGDDSGAPGGARDDTLAHRLLATGGVEVLGGVVVAEVARSRQRQSPHTSGSGGGARPGWRWPLVDALVLLEYAIAQSTGHQESLTPALSKSVEGAEADAANVARVNFIDALLFVAAACSRSASAPTASSSFSSSSLSSPSSSSATTGESATAPSTEVVLSATLRVLINLTHHNPPAVAAVSRWNGLQGVLACFLRAEKDALAPLPPPASPRRAPSSSFQGSDWLLEDDANIGDDHDSQRKSQQSACFDRMLLALNVLTNCVEISAEARSLVSEMRVRNGEEYDDAAANYDVVVGSGKGRGEGGRRASASADKTCVLHLVDFLNARCAGFAAELAKDLDKDDAGPDPSLNDGQGEESEDADWDVEDLVLAGYCSLLLGCLMRDHPTNRLTITEALESPRQFPSSSSSSSSSRGGLFVLIRVLKAFVALQSSAGVLTAEAVAPVLALIEEMEVHVNDSAGNTHSLDTLEQHSTAISSALSSSSSSSSSSALSSAVIPASSKQQSPSKTERASTGEESPDRKAANSALKGASTTAAALNTSPQLAHLKNDETSVVESYTSRGVRKRAKDDTQVHDSVPTVIEEDDLSHAREEVKMRESPQRKVRTVKVATAENNGTRKVGTSTGAVVTYRQRRRQPPVDTSTSDAAGQHDSASDSGKAEEASTSALDRSGTEEMEQGGMHTASVAKFSSSSTAPSKPRSTSPPTVELSTNATTMPVDPTAPAGSKRSDRSRSPATNLLSTTYRRKGKPFKFVRKSKAFSFSSSVSSSSALQESIDVKVLPKSKVKSGTVRSASEKCDDDDIDILFGNEDELSLLGLASPPSSGGKRSRKSLELKQSPSPGGRRSRRGKP